MSLRKLFIATLILGILAAPRAADAQQAGKVPRIGLLSPFSPSATALWHEAFRQGLRDLGSVSYTHLTLPTTPYV